MFDTAALQAVKTGAVAHQAAPALSTLSEDQLRELRREIDALLPERSLSSVNLEDELLAQYLSITRLQNLIIDDPETPANQKAQVANSVAATLQNLVAMQTKYHTAERFKAIEGLMIRYFKKLPVDVVEAFLAEYERLE